MEKQLPNFDEAFVLREAVGSGKGVPKTPEQDVHLMEIDAQLADLFVRMEAEKPLLVSAYDKRHRGGTFDNS